MPVLKTGKRAGSRPQPPEAGVRSASLEAAPIAGLLPAQLLLWAQDADKVLLICPTSQAKMPATHWHDGQITWLAQIDVK